MKAQHSIHSDIIRLSAYLSLGLWDNRLIRSWQKATGWNLEMFATNLFYWSCYENSAHDLFYLKPSLYLSAAQEASPPDPIDCTENQILHSCGGLAHLDSQKVKSI